MLASQQSNNQTNNKKSATQYSAVSSSRNSNKMFNTPHHLGGASGGAPGGNVKSPIMITNQSGKVLNNANRVRQQSPPVVVRHVFTSNQGIPVTMAVLPQSQSTDVSILFNSV